MKTKVSLAVLILSSSYQTSHAKDEEDIEEV